MPKEHQHEMEGQLRIHSETGREEGEDEVDIRMVSSELNPPRMNPENLSAIKKEDDEVD